MDGKRFVKTMLAAAAGMTMMAAGAALAQDAAKQPYLVGSINQMTGGAAVFGRPAVAGATAFFKWLNDNGGINGRQVKFEALDAQLNPDIAVVNAKRLIGEGMVLLLGPIASATAISVLPVVTAAKVPMVSHFGVEQLEKESMYYAMGLTGTINYKIAANYLKSRSNGPANVAFLMVDSPALAAARAATIEVIQGWGWKVAEVQTFAPAATEFSAQILKVAGAKPDFIVAALTDSQAPIAMAALQRAGVTVPVINYHAGSAETTFKAIASEQFMAIRDFIDVSTPGDATKPLQDAAAKYGLTRDMTGNLFTKGWVSGQLIASVLKSCDPNCTSESARAALEAIKDFDTKGLGPSITFSPTQKIGVTMGRVFQWNAKDGRAVPITPFIDGSK